MPSDTLSLSVGTGLGVSVLAGIISGVCFVMGYRRIHKKRGTKWHCAVCNKYFRSPEFILGETGFVICSNCNNKVCKSTCSLINPNSLWVCRTCNESTVNWIYGALKAAEPIKKVFCGNMGPDQKLPDDLEDHRKDEEEKKKEQVRTFIERLVNNLLGDDIDDASINEIYSDRKYRRMLEKYHRDLSSILTDLGTSLQISLIHLPVVGESPCSAHSALKRIIQKIIREANDLPKLKNIDQSDSSNQESRTYEDLLSTAIINKIISASQNNISLSYSRTNSVCSHRSSSLRRRKLHKDYIFGEESLHNKKKWRHDTDTASISSLEEWVHSDSSRGSTKYVDRVSLTIKQRIEEVSSSESEAEVEYGDNDDVEYDNLKSAVQDAEPNWFLQKRQFRGLSCSPVPVSMLVPDSTKEAKVLIGDKEIDDTSDLSDVPSDFEDNSLPTMEVKNHLLDSKKLIGGNNSMADFYSSNFSDDEISGDSGVKECKYMDEVDSELLSTPNKNESKFATDVSISSDDSNTERDTEYTEKFGTLPRKISISPNQDESTDSPICGNTALDITEYKNDLKAETEDENNPNFTGVYSKREKEKWSHAVELEYNPYSKENIEKRMKSRNSVNSLFVRADFSGSNTKSYIVKMSKLMEVLKNDVKKGPHRFGSDYYIRQASLPSGTKKNEEKTLHFTEEADTFQSEEQPVSKITTIGIEQNPPVRLQNDKLVLMARPFNVTELPKQKAKPKSSNSVEKSKKGYDLGLHFASEFSSDSEVSLVNCYDVTESVIYKKLSAENNEEIQTAEKYFDFESLETSLNLEVEKENEKVEVIRPDIPKETPQSPMINNKSDLAGYVNSKTESEESHTTTIPYVITKRSDNTLIKKIYSDPSVRSFALSRRKMLPSTIELKDFENERGLNREQSSEILKPLLMKSDHSLDNRKISKEQQSGRTYVKSSKSMEEDISKQKIQLEKQTLLIDENTKIKSSASTTFSKQNESNEIHINNHHVNISANDRKNNSDREAIEEIDKLKKQKLVANRLKVFSKSTLDLSSTEVIDKMITFSKINRDEVLYFRNENVETLSELQRERSSSVRDIRKKFEKYDADAKIENSILHSLTGRSLSKQFKEKLRNFDGDIPSLSQIHSLSLTNLEVEENTR